MKQKADIGLVGLAVMGENLVLNMESKGFTVACFNRTVSKVDNFINGHGKVLHEIGYHTRDFFLKQWDKYKNYPWGVLAHSTHVKGIGTYDDGIEKPRLEVILATGIPEDVCRQVNLGYMDYRSLNKSDFEGREDEGILYIPKGGEILYRRKADR